MTKYTVGIYSLRFPNTDKLYIGQSTHIELRYSQHLANLRAGRGTTKLQEAYDKYGTPSLFIEDIVSSVSELDAKESFYIQEYNSINNGFNSCAPGFSTFEGVACWSEYSSTQIKKVFAALVHTDYDYSSIEEVTGVGYSVIRDIANGNSHYWLSTRYPRQYRVLLSKLNTRPRIKFNKDKIVSILEALVDNSLTHKEIAEHYNTTIDVVRSISKFKAHSWLKDEYPVLYSKLKELKNTTSFNKSSKYTKEDILEIVEYYIQGMEYQEIEDITGIPVSTQKNIISQRQHKWLSIEYPELLERINLRLKPNKSLIYSKYTKDQIISSINMFLIGENTSVPKKTLLDIVRKGTHKWVGQEYPDLFEKLIRRVNNGACRETAS